MFLQPWHDAVERPEEDAGSAVLSQLLAGYAQTEYGRNGTRPAFRPSPTIATLFR